MRSKATHMESKWKCLSIITQITDLVVAKQKWSISISRELILTMSIVIHSLNLFLTLETTSFYYYYYLISNVSFFVNLFYILDALLADLQNSVPGHQQNPLNHPYTGQNGSASSGYGSLRSRQSPQSVSVILLKPTCHLKPVDYLIQNDIAFRFYCSHHFMRYTKMSWISSQHLFRTTHQQNQHIIIIKTAIRAI